MAPQCTKALDRSDFFKSKETSQEYDIKYDFDLLNTRRYELLSDSVTISKSAAGKLSKHFDFWLNVPHAEDFTLDLMKNGYKLPMTTIPPFCFSNNNKSALKHPEFVANAIGKLLDDGRITEVFSPPRCINPLTVVESKKLRLV